MLDDVYKVISIPNKRLPVIWWIWSVAPQYLSYDTFINSSCCDFGYCTWPHWDTDNISINCWTIFYTLTTGYSSSKPFAENDEDSMTTTAVGWRCRTVCYNSKKLNKRASGLVRLPPFNCNILMEQSCSSHISGETNMAFNGDSLLCILPSRPNTPFEFTFYSCWSSL